MTKPVTKDDIYLAADCLASAGIMPSNDRVRDLIGHGSETTIQKHLKTWKLKLLSQYTEAKEFAKMAYLNEDLQKKITSIRADIKAMMGAVH